MFEPFYIHTARFINTSKPIDDGLKPTWFGRISNLFNPKEPKKVPANTKVQAFPFSHEHTPLCCLSISLTKGYKVAAEMVEELLFMLSSATAPISFEIIATHESIRLQWVCRITDARLVHSQLVAYFPDIVIYESDEESTSLINEDLGCYMSDFGLKEEFMRPLKMKGRFDPDPYIGLFGSLEQLHEGEQAAIQILFQGTINPWSESILQSVMDTGGQPFFLDAPEMVPLSKEKISAPLFSVIVRVIGQGDGQEDSFSVFQRISDGIRKTTQSPTNSLIPLSSHDYPIDEYYIDILSRQSRRTGMLLNSRELAILVHFPSASVLSNKLERDSQRTKLAPDITIGHQLILGTNYHQGIEQQVSVHSSQRLKHTHIIGATGTGKSTLLTNLITQDIQNGNGLAVLDPHGDLIETILSRIPEKRRDDVVLIDSADSEYPIGFNILSAHSEIEKEILSSDLVNVFKRLSTSWGDQMNSVLANAILAFLESNKGGTLMDLRRFLIEKPFREQFLKTVTDPAITYYWQKEYPLLKTNSIGPILTRLDAFLRPKLIRNMIAQKKGLDFGQLLNTKKIVLIKLSQGLIGTDNSYLLGTFMVAKIHQAAMARQAKAITDRTDFFLYIDEFQNFITESMSAILSGARKYYLGLVLAHQDMQQLTRYDTELANSFLSNAGTRICFRVGEQDARKLEDGFSFFDAKDLQNLKTGEAIVRIDRPENDFNLTTTQVEEIGNKQAETAKDQIVLYSRNTYGTPKHEVETFLQETIVSYQPPEIKEALVEKPVLQPKTVEEKIEEPREVVEEKNVVVPIEELPEETVTGVIERKLETQHRYIQALIKRMAEARGYKATMEALTPNGNGRVDVSLEKNQKRIACEVCITTPHTWEVQNIQKCLTARYDIVVSISPEKKILQSIRHEVETSIPKDQQAKILFFEPDAFFAYLDEEITKEANTETRFKGYRVKVEYNAIPETVAKSKHEHIVRTIMKSDKTKK